MHVLFSAQHCAGDTVQRSLAVGAAAAEEGPRSQPPCSSGACLNASHACASTFQRTWGLDFRVRAPGLGGLFCHTGLLLGRCMDAPWMHSYPDIGERAFGPSGRMAVAIMLYAELYLTSVDLLILAGDNLGAVAPGFQPFGAALGAAGAWTVVATALALPTVWLRSLGLLAWLSALGVVVSFGLTALVAWEGALLGFPHRSPPALRPAGALLALGLVSFNYGGHALFPSLISAMRRRSAYPRVLCATFAAVIAVYVASAALGYSAFGDAAKFAPAAGAACHRLGTKESLALRTLSASSTDASLIWRAPRSLHSHA